MHIFTSYLHGVCATDDAKGDAGFELRVVRLKLVVLVRIAVGELVDLNVVLLDLLVDLRFQSLQL